MADTEQEDFHMSRDEMARFSDAMKDKTFRELLIEYANEISDPANKKKYEDEIIAMEKQRGQDVRFLKPQSGFVIKTVRLSDNMKVFLNVCTSPEVAEYTIQKVEGRDQLSLPHSISPVRDDIDKSSKPCVVYDVCFHPKCYERAMKEEKFRCSLIESAFDSIENRLSVKLDRKNKKFPKMKYKGFARPLLLRSEKDSQGNNNSITNEHLKFPYPSTNGSVTEQSTENNGNVTGSVKSPKVNGFVTEKCHDSPVVPNYKLIHRGYFEMTEYTQGSGNTTTNTSPKELVVEIELPLAKSSNGIDLDIFEKQLILKSEKPSYYLDIPLPHKVNEDRGKAQFDKFKKVLTVTLPILKPPIVEGRENNQPTPSPLIEECPISTSNGHKESTLHNGHTLNGHSDNSDAKQTCSKQDNKNSTNPPMVSGVHPAHEVNKNDKETRRSNSGEVLPKTVGVEELEDAEFDTKVFESLPVNSQLPPYSYDQTDEKVVLVVNIPNIQVQHLSLGFTEKQVCLSFPQNVEDAYSPDWNMIVRLDDRFSLDKDECGFELFPDRLELYLRKKSNEMWNRFFVGVSETDLKMELFISECRASDMLEKFRSLNVDKLPRAEVKQTDEERTTVAMEGHLEQLLVCQEKQRTLDLARRMQEEDEEESSDEIDEISNQNKHKGYDYYLSSEGSDLDFKVNLMDLVDDVIDENSPLTSPTSSSLTSENQNQKLLERSMSHDPYQHPRLRSILKRSKSDGGTSSGCDTDDDSLYQRTRATTFTNSNVYSEPEHEFGRRRNKSVSFLEEPIIFEIEHASKRQWKRAMWERKQREQLKKKRSKQREKDNDTKSDLTTSTDDDKMKETTEVLQTKEKQGRKTKKAEKKRNRNNSESRSEEEGDNGQTKKKGKRRTKKNKKGGNMNLPSTHSGSDSMGTEGGVKPSLNNSLIFELD